MKERPILFSTPMVRAILNGSKTQTRRIVKPQPFEVRHGLPFTMEGLPTRSISCPYGQAGDRLWVRETFGLYGDKEQHVLHYRATHHRDGAGMGWKPSIHMPRWASRITLEITGVRVERLHEINESDAVAEGVERYTGDQNYWRDYFANPNGSDRRSCLTAKESFCSLWSEINGAGSWDANPWVWCIEFRRVETD